MNRILLVALLVILAANPCLDAGDDAAKALQGVWVAKSMKANGTMLPAEEVKRMQWTFQGDKLLMRGNFLDDREEACTYRLDPTQTPKHFDLTPPIQKRAAVLGIYEVKGDRLTLCLRRGDSTKGRPTEFASKVDTDLILIVLERKKP